MAVSPQEELTGKQRWKAACQELARQCIQEAEDTLASMERDADEGPITLDDIQETASMLCDESGLVNDVMQELDSLILQRQEQVHGS